MYTADPVETNVPDDWEIKDPDGDVICIVNGKSNAATLLSHLNR